MGYFLLVLLCFDSPNGLVKILHTKPSNEIYELTFTAPRMYKADVLFIHTDSPLVLALVAVRDTLS